MTRPGAGSGRHRLENERGSGTVLAVAAVGTMLICLVGGLTVVAVVQAAHTARAAADLAVLSAAAAAQHGASPQAACARAGQVAAFNDGVLRACGVDAGGRVTLEVTADVRPPLPALVLGSARARARAGTVL